MKKNIILFLLSFIATFVQAQLNPLGVEIEINDEDGIHYNEESVEVFLYVKNSSEHQLDFNTKWNIFTDSWHPLKSVPLQHSIGSDDIMRIDCPMYRFTEHGFYRIQVEVSSSYGDTTVQRIIGIDPEKIDDRIDKKEDFDSFWQSALGELEKVNPAYKLTPVKRDKDAKTDLFKVEMKSYGDLTVRGWLEVPKKKGVYPALLRVPGYTENMQPIDQADDLIVFSFNTRDHGESDDSEGGRSWDMWVRGLDSKDNYYYKGLFLDCLLAMDYLCQRDDVDTTRIAVWGGSQGGGLSFITAALDKRVSLCIADIPYMCEYPRYFEITYWQELSNWFNEHPDVTWQIVLNTLCYYDTKNFANKITCPVWMGIGLQDDVCPPATSFVTYNKINAEKNFVVYKNQYHWQPDEHYVRRFKELREFFEMDEK